MTKATMAERTSAWSLLLLGAWLGVVAGFGEVAIRLSQLRVLGERIWLSQQFVWMAPTADLVVYGLIGVIIALLARRWPRPFGVRAVVFTCLFVMIATTLITFERLHIVAVLLLALGLAYQGARLAGRFIPALVRVARLTLAPALMLIALAAVTVNVGLARAEQSRLAALPAARAIGPNVLLIILDTVRAASLGLYGYARATTPNLDGLAESSLVFERAIATSPWTLPSHASFFTGHYPDGLETSWKIPLGDSPPTLAELFAEHGYRTGGFSGNLGYVTYENGLDRGFVRFEDYPVSLSMVAYSSFPARLLTQKIRDLIRREGPIVSRSAAQVRRGLVEWLEQPAPRERPFFAFVNFFDAHAPYTPPAPFDTLFGGIERLPSANDVYRRWTPEEFVDGRDAYDAEIAYLDFQLGLLFDHLRRRGLLDQTIVIVTSDHGELIGEHGLIGHANSLYTPLLHVPLLIRFPGGRHAGRRVNEVVTLADLPATILQLAGLPRGPIPGTPLVGADGSLVAGRPARASVDKAINMPEWLPASRGDMAAVTVGSLHYIRNGDGREELYDVLADPLEARDLAGSPPYAAQLRHMRDLVRGDETGAARLAAPAGRLAQ